LIQPNSPAYWRATLALCIGSFMVFANVYITQPLLPTLAAEFDISALEASWTFTITTLTLGLSLLAYGALSDSLGRRGIMFATLVGVVACAVGLSFVSNYEDLLLLRALQGLMLGGVPAIAIAYMNDEFSPRALALAVGLYIGGNTLGGISGRLIGGFVGDWLGWQGAFSVMALVSLLCVVSFALLLPKSQHFEARPLRLDLMLKSMAGHLRTPSLLIVYLIGGFNFFIFLSLYFLILTIEKPTNKKSNSLVSGSFIGLAIITKGPVGLLLLILTLLIYLIAKKGKVKIKPITVFLFFISSLGVTFLWFGYETITNSPWFILEFIHYQIELLTEPVAGHQQPFYYHFVVVLLGCFPMSILAIPMFFKKQPNIPYNLLLWMKILFWVVMILFTIVETKIVHYSSMSYLPLSFLSAIYLYFFLGLKEKKIELKALKTSYITIGAIFGTLLTIVPIVFKNHTWITPYIKDDFAVASFQNPINWGGWEFIFGLLFLAGLFWSLIYFIKEKVNQFLTVLVFATGTTLLGYSIFIVPKIEQFSQGPAIDFYESMQGKDVYVTTLGFKSYGQYFYTLFPPRTEKDEIEVLKNNYKKSLVTPNSYDANELNSLTNEWLLKGNIDKDVYLVTKITKREEMKLYTDISFIENKGGFDFYVRKHN